MNNKLESLIEYCKSNNRIIPVTWTKFWEMLPNRKRKGAGWEPPLPLILGAWWHSSEREKQGRFIYHIKYAAENGILDEADEYLRNLTEEEWCHKGNAGRNTGDHYFNFGYTEPKEKPSDEKLEELLEMLEKEWDNIVGKNIGENSVPISFSGEKARQLNVKVINELVKPEWGSWWNLDSFDKTHYFTEFRNKINQKLKPHNVDHIVFFMKGKKSV